MKKVESDRSRADSNVVQPSYTVPETVSKNANWNEGTEAMIKKNLMIGNL